MAKVVVGIFDKREDAESAIDDLRAIGLKERDISVVMKNKEEKKEFADDTGTDVVGGATTGATTGAVIGGLAGLLGAIAIPGLGAFLIGGPIAAVLGLTGAAAATVSGAATGAVAGGLLGALTGLGLSEDEAEEYEEHINQGGIFMAVPTTKAQKEDVSQILRDNNAQNIRSIGKEEVSEYKDMSARSHAGDYSSAYAGAKGGKSKSSQGRGWHGESKELAEAARSKGGRANRSQTNSKSRSRS